MATTRYPLSETFSALGYLLGENPALDNLSHVHVSHLGDPIVQVFPDDDQDTARAWLALLDNPEPDIAARVVRGLMLGGQVTVHLSRDLFATEVPVAAVFAPWVLDAVKR